MRTHLSRIHKKVSVLIKKIKPGIAPVLVLMLLSGVLAYLAQRGSDAQNISSSNAAPLSGGSEIYTITNSSIPGWHTYTNLAYHFAFDFPSSFKLEGYPAYRSADNRDVLKIGLSKDENSNLTIFMNKTDLNCGESVRKISTQNLDIAGQTITKYLVRNKNSSDKCLEYKGLGKGDDNFYAIGHIFSNSTSSESSFDSIVSSFRFSPQS